MKQFIKEFYDSEVFDALLIVALVAIAYGLMLKYTS